MARNLATITTFAENREELFHNISWTITFSGWKNERNGKDQYGALIATPNNEKLQKYFNPEGLKHPVQRKFRQHRAPILRRGEKIFREYLRHQVQIAQVSLRDTVVEMAKDIRNKEFRQWANL